MGNGNTKLTVCTFCGSDQLINPESNSNNKHLFCVRCHVSTKQLCALSHIFVAPFEDTLDNVYIHDEAKEINEQFLIDKYLIPYFKLEKELLPIRAGKRFIIDCIEFKVIGCYPPRGFVANKTQFHLNDENEKLIKLQFCPLQQIHLLPTETSLQTYSAQHPSENERANNTNNNSSTISTIYHRFVSRSNESSSDSNSNSSNDESNDSDSNPTINYSNSHLYSTHVKPYLLKRDDQKLFSIRTKNITINTENTAIIKDNNVSEKAFKRHLIPNETFFYKGIQFRVQHCIPFTGGFLTSQTNILLHGQPLTDIQEMSLRPIFEDLPSNHKHLLPNEIKQLYLDPHFKRQAWCYISYAHELRIRNVRFSIRRCIPNAHGIITCLTKFNFNATPIKAQLLRCMQEEEDMCVARNMMNEEKEMEEYVSNRQRLQNTSQQLMLAAEYELRSSDPFSQIIHDLFQRILERRYRAAQLERERNRGIHPSLINRLPTFAFKRPLSLTVEGLRAEKTMAGNIVDRYEYEDEDDEEKCNRESGDVSTDSESEDLEEELQRMMNQSNINISCRICLEYYINGEELRILPCFHKYHKDCVDKWFRMSRKCPICKTPVVRPVAS